MISEIYSTLTTDYFHMIFKHSALQDRTMGKQPDVENDQKKSVSRKLQGTGNTEISRDQKVGTELTIDLTNFETLFLRYYCQT